jgi:hypothetical protein
MDEGVIHFALLTENGGMKVVTEFKNEGKDRNNSPFKFSGLLHYVYRLNPSQNHVCKVHSRDRGLTGIRDVLGSNLGRDTDYSR